MPNFQAIENKNQIKLSAAWTDSPKFQSKGRIVGENGKQVNADYNGRRYRLISKKERTFSTSERLARGFLGLVAVIVTLGFGVFFKAVKDLFTKDKEKIRYGSLIATPIIQENPRIDIEKEASRFYFKENEQHIADKIEKLIDFQVHEYMTSNAIYQDYRQHIREKGFEFTSQQALTHPKLEGWIMKGGGSLKLSFIKNQAGTTEPNKYDHLMRVFMAERMKEVIEEEGLDIVIPEKRLVPSIIPSAPDELHKKYYVFSKKMDILSSSETVEALRKLPKNHQRKVARDICTLIKRTGFMDAHLENIRWSPSLQKIAIIDTESQGLLIEKNDRYPRKVEFVEKCAIIGLQELKERVGAKVQIFAEEADKILC